MFTNCILYISTNYHLVLSHANYAQVIFKFVVILVIFIHTGFGFLR